MEDFRALILDKIILAAIAIIEDHFLAQIGHSPYYLRVLTLPSVTV
jgi:hypothetical protein